MIRCITALFAVALLAACGADDSSGTSSDAAAPEASEGMATAAERASVPNGIQAYEKTCAGCHEEGVNGAPRIGHPEDWSGRSSLWEAVLFEHAKQGFLNMPAKGGDATLADSDVARAAEYMLRSTFPDVPPD